MKVLSPSWANLYPSSDRVYHDSLVTQDVTSLIAFLKQDFHPLDCYLMINCCLLSSTAGCCLHEHKYPLAHSAWTWLLGSTNEMRLLPDIISLPVLISSWSLPAHRQCSSAHCTVFYDCAAQFVWVSSSIMLPVGRSALAAVSTPSTPSKKRSAARSWTNFSSSSCDWLRK